MSKFGEGPIIQQDIAYYIEYFGDEPPAPRFGAKDRSDMSWLPRYDHWMDIQRRIVQRLSTQDFQAFCDAIKSGKDDGKKEMLVAKILNCSDAQQETLAKAKAKNKYPSGTRVRLGEDKGRITFVMMGGSQYGLVLDKAKQANPHCTTMKTVKPEQLVPVCAVCDALDGAYSCSKCKVAFYCGRDCQKKGWPTHKKKCGKTDTDSFCLL